MFRFTIRDVLWLTVVVALAVGWKTDHGRLLTSLKSAVLFRDQTIQALHDTEANLEWKIEMLVELGEELDQLKAKSEQANTAKDQLAP
jgi:hypothetical protein